MTIETKYDQKDEVWTIKENKILSGKVDDIYISYTSRNKKATIVYTLKGTNTIYGKKYEEKELYKTREELIGSL